MQRLYDTIQLSGGTFWSMHGRRVEFVKEPVVIIADEVGQIARERINAGEDIEFANVMPPYDDFIVESTVSPWPMFYMGKEVDTVGISYHTMMFAELEDGIGDAFESRADRMLVEQLVDKTTLSKYIESSALDDPNERIVFQVGRPMFRVGQYVHEFGLTSFHITHLDGNLGWRCYFIQDEYGRVQAFEADDSALDALIFGRLVDEMGMMTISLMHCSNVDTEDTEPERTRQMKRQIERKRKAKKPVTFKKLIVRPTGRKSRQNDGGSGRGSDDGVALHLVRGHFKTYSPDSPLFGRFTGTYWWSPMVRGTAPRIVVKDYDVKTGRKEEV